MEAWTTIIYCIHTYVISVLYSIENLRNIFYKKVLFDDSRFIYYIFILREKSVLKGNNRFPRNIYTKRLQSKSQNTSNKWNDFALNWVNFVLSLWSNLQHYICSFNDILPK